MPDETQSLEEDSYDDAIQENINQQGTNIEPQGINPAGTISVPETPFSFSIDDEHIKSFITSILLCLIVPLLPLFLEYGFRSSVDIGNVKIAGSMYAINTALLSRGTLSRIFMSLFAVLLSAIYGHGMGNPNSTGPLDSPEATYILIATIFFMHLIERYNMHIIERKKFHIFTK